MESVEDIPASCILEGLPWNWETYGEYLDSIEQLPRGLNAGGYIGDVALRLYVCGARSCEDDFRASEDALRQSGLFFVRVTRAGVCWYSSTT